MSADKYIAAIGAVKRYDYFTYSLGGSVNSQRVLFYVNFSEAHNGRSVTVTITGGFPPTPTIETYKVEDVTNVISINLNALRRLTFKIREYDTLQEILVNVGEIYAPTIIYPES